MAHLMIVGAQMLIMVVRKIRIGTRKVRTMVDVLVVWI